MNPNAPKLVCFALKEEADAFRKLAAGRADVPILVTGIGRQNAEAKVRAFLESTHPRFLLTCGFAGGLNAQLSTGDVLFATHDVSLRVELSAAGARLSRFHCASRIAVTAAEKAELRSLTGMDAVEMESEAIQALCRERRIPCATVRVVSDHAMEDLPLDFNRLSKPDASLDFRKLAFAVALAPGRIPALLRLQRNCRFAARRLAAVLARVTGLTHVP